MQKNEKKFKIVTESVLPNNKNSVGADNFGQRVERQAYELYAKRGFVYGHEWDDWFEAERLVGSQISVVDRDCIRSESFYKTTHQSKALPSGIDAQKINPGSFAKDF